MNPFDFDYFSEQVKKMRQVSLALASYAGDNFRNATKEEFDSRRKISDKCEFWNNLGFAGIGKCEKCGCSIAKLKIANSKCPIGLWSSIEIDTPST